MPTALRDHIEAASQTYCTKFHHAGLSSPPSRHFIFVTCMDARINTSEAWGIEVGDAHVIRNAGGSAADALRSIVVSSQLLGTKEIAIIKHTKCGMDGLTNEVVHSCLQKNLGIEAIAELKQRNMIDFIGVANGLEQGVRDDVQFLRQSTLVPNDMEVTGWIYDVDSGATRRII